MLKNQGIFVKAEKRPSDGNKFYEPVSYCVQIFLYFVRNSKSLEAK